MNPGSTSPPAPPPAAPGAGGSQLLPGLFRRAAERWPAEPAVIIPADRHRPPRTLTYAQLATAAGDLAARLQHHARPDAVIAILLARDSADLYVAQLAVLLAGAAYTCIDPAFPDEQLRLICGDAGVTAVVGDSAGAARVARAGVELPVVHPVPAAGSPAAPAFVPAASAPESLAYVIYTSGTTGRPKGVMIEHRAIANLVAGDLAEFGLGPGDRVGQSSSAAYDSSVEEIWLAWASGAALVLMDDATARLGPDLVPWLREHRVTVWCPPPTLLRATGCDDPERELPALRLLYVGGEALPPDVADRWSRGRRMVNGYGPTEVTVTSLRDDIVAGMPVAIGRPVPGVTAHVLDENLEAVADGGQGELCLAGVALARGYRGAEELTHSKFPSHPVYGRIYRTGDLVSRTPDGRCWYHGRMDAQVKLRGYRIELEAIEARMMECPGVGEAACRVQGDGDSAVLVAFCVAARGGEAPDPVRLRADLARVLPAYMVPAQVGILKELPRTVGGKLNRRALPGLAVNAGPRPASESFVAPRHELEARVAAAVARVLGARLGPPGTPLSVTADFFHDLAGDSLAAAGLISVLRDDPATAGLTVRDVYEQRTVAGLAGVAGLAPPPATGRAGTVRPRVPAWRATAVQALVLLAGLSVAAQVAWWASWVAMPWLMNRLGVAGVVLLSPVLFFVARGLAVPMTVLTALVLKRVLIGRYRPGRWPVWSGYHVRHWIVVQAVRLIPWSAVEGTEAASVILRLLGARVGRRVHLHRGVNLRQGGWDLLELGDDVSLNQDASVRLVDLEDGQMVVAPVRLGAGSTLEVRAGVAGDTVLEPGAVLAASSALSAGGVIPAGERWDGVPARPAGRAPEPGPAGPGTREWSPMAHGLWLTLLRLAVAALVSLPLGVVSLAALRHYSIESPDVMSWLTRPSFGWATFGVLLVSGGLSVTGMLLMEALAVRLLGRVRSGVLNRWDPAYARVWLKAGLVDAAGHWLSGTVFWPVWLRLAGMKVGKGCEISTIIDVVPELVDIGDGTFCADGIYLGGPRVSRGRVETGMTRLGPDTFLGNHVILPAGLSLPGNILLGVCTVAEPGMKGGTGWFGHPAFELPRREIVEVDRRLTHEPSLVRRVDRWMWEVLRFAIPVLPALATVEWYSLLDRARLASGAVMFHLLVLPGGTMALGGGLCALVLVLKWFLLGRVRPDTHPLWSCWCSRWDFLYVVWGMYAAGWLAALEGTLILQGYLRLMGCRIGRRVVLGNGFAHVVDPDMLHFEDDATVNCQFQAHTFEDRVLKIDHVHIRRGATVARSAVLLYGADVGAGTRVTAHSVVMKGERLLPDRTYSGCPTRPHRAGRES